MNGLKYIRSKIINETMDELAAQLGVSKQAVYLWESGRKPIPQKRLKQLVDLSGIPGNYFLIAELTERDQLEIRKNYLIKKLSDTVVEYEEEVYDSKGNPRRISQTYMDASMLSQIEYNDMEIRVDDLLKKITKAICGMEDFEKAVATGEPVYEMEAKANLFDQFADIVEENEEREYLYQILRAVDLFFRDSKNSLSGDMPPFSMDFVPDEAPLVQELYRVLYEKKRRTEQAVSRVKKTKMD